MLRCLLFSLLLISIGACSSKPQYTYHDPAQYCYQTTKIETDGDTVSSKGLTECTDKPRINHDVKAEGVASDCRLSRPLVKDSNPEYGSTLLCKFTDPTGVTVWRPVNEAFAYPNFD